MFAVLVARQCLYSKSVSLLQICVLVDFNTGILGVPNLTIPPTGVTMVFLF